MNPLLDLLRQRLWVWLAPLLFLVVNTGLLSMYRATYAGRVGVLREDLGRREDTLEKLEGQRRELDALLERATESRDGIRELYQERFSTERERLTDVIREVKSLARRAGLEPSAISYPEEQIEDYGLVKKSFVFGVAGDYRNLRRLINFLELSDSFLILEHIGVSEAGGSSPTLRISLRISTLFSQEQERSRLRERAEEVGG